MSALVTNAPGMAAGAARTATDETSSTALMRVTSARAVMRQKGRTFWLASRLLPAGLLDDVAVLYAFCRAVDDAVDEATSDAAAAAQAERLARELEGDAPRPEVAAFLDLAARRGLDLRFARELVAGVSSDVGSVRLESDAQLLRYAYLVAGTVGGLMVRLLGANDERALAPALELGIAMQLTNICRDVAEDAGRDRVYLPGERLVDAGLSFDDVLRGGADRSRLAKVIREVLSEADRHYEAARAGLRFLPWRARMAVAVAARLYRQIGVRLLAAQQGDPFAGRVVVPWQQKLRLAVSALFDLAQARSA